MTANVDGRRPPTVALVGVTASGKSALAMAAARAEPDIELISVDSMQVYRGLDVGTAKPTAAERAEVRHHVIDVADPWEEYSAARYQSDARAALAAVDRHGGRAVLVGGTGLYLRAVVDDLAIPGQWPDVAVELEAEPDTAALHRRLQQIDPAGAARILPDNRRRTVRALEVTLGSGRPFSSHGRGLTQYPPDSFPLVGLRVAPEVTAGRIAGRYAAQLEAGFLDEVATLVHGPQPLGRTAAQALGYRELGAHLRGELTLDEAVGQAIARTRRFARRQQAWFRRDPRIEWIDVDGDPRATRGAVLAALRHALDAQCPGKRSAGLRD